MKPSLARIRHARSKKDFPFLKLEEQEYVELAIERSKKGLVMIWAGALFAMIVLGAILAYALNSISSKTVIEAENMRYFWLLVGCLFVMLLLAALIASKIYLANKLFVTNKRLIHYSQESLFSKSMNVIELARIEDVSYKQTSVMDHIMSVGTLRMSTVGDETTYTFSFVDTPTDEVETIAHLIHKTKKK